jgi:hypothetical protein
MTKGGIRIALQLAEDQGHAAVATLIRNRIQEYPLLGRRGGGVVEFNRVTSIRKFHPCKQEYRASRNADSRLSSQVQRMGFSKKKPKNRLPKTPPSVASTTDWQDRV